MNNIPSFEEKSKANWSDVQNQYQRRADLIPNLVETVKGYATQEREVLTQVTEARAKASQIKVDASTVRSGHLLQDIAPRLGGVPVAEDPRKVNVNARGKAEPLTEVIAP